MKHYKMSKRLRFLLWLRYDICKEKEGTIPSRFLKTIYAILFPIRSFIERNSIIRFDPWKMTYTIEGLEVRAEVFWHLKNYKHTGVLDFQKLKDLID